MTNIIELKRKPDTELIKFLEVLLEDARNGTLLAVTVYEELPENTYRISGTTTMSRLQTSGMLLEAAVDRLRLREN